MSLPPKPSTTAVQESLSGCPRSSARRALNCIKDDCWAIFTDCAITADADYLLTEDAHFAPLADAGYKPQLLSPQRFIAQFVPSGR